jgi:uncharacterized protein (TIGR02300 family)
MNFGFDRGQRPWQLDHSQGSRRRAVDRRNESRSTSVVKPEWGTKCLCLSCGARFYDLRRKKVACPKCAAPYEAPAPLKPRRGAAAQASTTQAKPDVTDKPDAPVAAKDVEPETSDKDDNGAAEDVIEDASELGKDEDDVAEVVDSSRKGDKA